MDMKDSYESDHNQLHSSYMLIEATGDSEVDSNDPNMNGFGYEIVSVDYDDDDAQSCCHDNAAEFKFKTYESWNDDDDDEKKNKEGDVNVYGSSYCEDDEMQEQNNYKSYVSDDSSDKEFVDEMEKNRLFWEACLAS
ncbi:hypothetical protein TSUD_341460 [Trifolium subterraneum]|uniref:Uncharacterized protein n=1 Tax=Trifolium subterraneum TaxID=3900 RepID=A0A2Z6LNI4_TRISU|nr:hypothetical protein TSUD_341460 [Trifolium subterraneum]